MADSQVQELTTAEAALVSGYPQATIRSWIRRGELPARRDERGQYRIRPSHLEAMVVRKAGASTRPAATTEHKPARSQLASRFNVILNHPIISGVVATVVGSIMVALIAALMQWINPDEPASVGVVIEDPIRVVQQQVTMAEFLVDYFDLRDVNPQDSEAVRTALRTNNLPSEVADSSLQTVGTVLAYDVVFHRLTDRTCTVTWTVYDAATKRALPDAYSRDQPAFPHQTLTPTADEDRASERIWIPQPPRAGPFYLRLEILDSAPLETRVPLGSAESEHFE